MGEDFPSREQLQEWLEYWQPRLQLRDWRVRVEYVKGKDLDNRNNSAECWSNLDNKFCVIKIAEDHIYELPDLMDFEETIVHELLHCHIDTFSRESVHGADKILEEQCVSSLARSFVSLRRELEKEKTDAAA